MRNKKLRGVTPIISSILLVGVLAAVTGVAYQWGLPMIQKNMDVSSLTKAENFLMQLDNKIDIVAVSGSTEEILFDLPGTIRINPENDLIEISLETTGSIYASGGFVCFSRNCNLESGVFGDDSYSVIGVQTEQTDEDYSLTTFSITQRNLTSSGKTYWRDIITPDGGVTVGGGNSRFIISKEKEERVGSTMITVIKIDIL